MVIIGKGHLCSKCKHKKTKKRKFKIKPSSIIDWDKCIICQHDTSIRFNMCEGCLYNLKY